MVSHPHRPADAPEEYAYVATRPIELGGVRAYNIGDHVAKGVIDEHGLAESVAKVGTKAAEQAAPEQAPAKPPAKG